MSASVNLRTAWLRTEGGRAIVCSWCPDKASATARAERAGLMVSHGICGECVQQYGFAGLVSQQVGGHSCAVGSATAGRDRHFFDAGTAPHAEHSRGGPRADQAEQSADRASAPASTPTAPAAGVGSLSLAELALICGVQVEWMPGYFRLMKWRNGEHYHGTGPEARVRLASLPELVGLLSTIGGASALALRLSLWLTRAQEDSYPAAQENPFSAGSGGAGVSTDAGRAAGIAAAPAQHPLSWLNAWEAEHG